MKFKDAIKYKKDLIFLCMVERFNKEYENKK